MKKTTKTKTTKRTRTSKRLAVRREVVKQLTDAHLDNVAGGRAEEGFERQGCCSPMRTN